jgi:regulator of protease activity HflC (stomatin/prohibitin superfamily)
MFLLALLLLVAGFAAWRFKSRLGYPLSKQLGIVQWLGFGFGAVFVLASMAVVVPVGHVGVKELFGHVDDDPLAAGMHLINPLKQVHEMEVRTRNYTMSSVTTEGQKQGDDSISVIAADQLMVKLDVAVLYSLQPDACPKIYKSIGMDVDEKIVRSEIRTALRDAAAAFSASELYTSKRAAFVELIDKSLRASLTNRGVMLEQVLLRNVMLPDQITKAINDKLAADQESQKMTFVLTKEKQEAERKRIEAEGIANSQRIMSQSLTPQIIEYQRIQALRAIGEKGNLIITPMGGGTPLINVTPKK